MWKPPIGDAPDLDVLHPGVPPWLTRGLRDWIGGLFEYNAVFYNQEGALANEYDRLTRSGDPLSRAIANASLGGVVLRRGEDYTLNFIDFLLYKIGAVYEKFEIALPLARALSEGGSKWGIREVDGVLRLSERVTETVQLQAEAVIGGSSNAGALLGEAWHAVYGRSPDHEEAYEKAIKAVEEAAAPVVSPKNARATLGTIVRDMKAQGDWALPIADPPGHADRATLIVMAETLWLGQESRHGGNGYRKPTSIEAEAAVTLAVALVHVFTRGIYAARSQ